MRLQEQTLQTQNQLLFAQQKYDDNVNNLAEVSAEGVKFTRWLMHECIEFEGGPRSAPKERGYAASG